MSDMESLRKILEESPKDKVKIEKALGELETVSASQSLIEKTATLTAALNSSEE